LPVRRTHYAERAADRERYPGGLLGAAVSPAFYLLSAFVGAGLVFAGATGFCGMARVLELMPWNRRAAA
jgi:hypothetical protein